MVIFCNRIGVYVSGLSIFLLMWNIVVMQSNG